jgi:hypothetical protein
MLTLDVFKGDGFSMLSLTDAVNQLPYVPGQIGRLGLFQETGVATNTIEIEEDGGRLTLIPTQQRNGPANKWKSSTRKVRSLNIPHIPLEDEIQASEIQGVREFGKTELQTAEGMIRRRQADMVPSLDATIEYARLGAIKGTILDADGTTTIYNLFTEFGVTQDTVDFVLGTAGTDIRNKCVAVSRLVEDALGNGTYDHIHVVCGSTFFDRLVAHANVIDTYRYQEGQKNREDLRKGFTYGGITFEEYRGSVGGVNFVAASEGHAFPVGVPGLFRTVYGPGNFLETANTLGLPRYSKIAFDNEWNRWVKVLLESNPLNYCVKPKVLVKLITSN